MKMVSQFTSVIKEASLVYTTGALILVGIYIIWQHYKKLSTLPGPRGLPVIGNALQLHKKNPHEQLSRWAKQYGDVFKINLFGKEVVVVNGLEGITQVLLTKSEEFSGRPQIYRWHLLFGCEDIVLNSLTPKCALMKKLSMVGLKQFGEKLQQLENLIKEMSEEFFEKLKGYKGQDIDIRADLTALISHITFALVFGRGLSSPEHREFLEIEQELLEYLDPEADNVTLDLFPWLRGPWYSKHREAVRICNRAKAFYIKQLNKTIEEHNADDMSCALDGLIQERNRAIRAKEHGAINLTNLRAAGTNLTSAGIGTTTSALYYLILLLASDQNLQLEVHHEIIKVIGQRPPTVQDRFTLPYIESLIFELLRLMSHVPVAVPHKAEVNTSLEGFAIPKGTEVWCNLWFLHHNEELWKDPWNFNPRRFLDNQGNLVLADHPLRKQFLAFGAGRRVCAGELVARNRLFLFITALIQRFKFLPAEGATYDTDPRHFRQAFILSAKDFKVIVDLWEFKN